MIIFTFYVQLISKLSKRVFLCRLYSSPFSREWKFFKKKNQEKEPCVNAWHLSPTHLSYDPKHHKWGGTLHTKSSFLRGLCSSLKVLSSRAIASMDTCIRGQLIIVLEPSTNLKNNLNGKSIKRKLYMWRSQLNPVSSRCHFKIPIR